MNIDTREVKNFLSDSELNFIDRFLQSSDPAMGVYHDIDSETNQHICDCIPFDLYDKKYKSIAKILLPKITQEFGNNLIVETSHLLQSYVPYGVHSDVLSGGHKLNNGIIPAWTFIIPLADYNSNTIVFNEESPNYKTVHEWIVAENRQPLDSISNEFIDTYLDHCWVPHVKYLSVESIFPWTKGSLFAASRSKFHTSDNYPKHGIKQKRALIFWTGYVENTTKYLRLSSPQEF